ncbi:MAG: PKD domain-containing protein [Bacteroidia bacterium]
MQRVRFILSALFFSISASAQLVTDNTYTPDQLVDVIVADGIVVSNVVMNCPQLANAYFDGTATNIGMTTGILLTSGDASLANGPNSDAGAGACNNSQGDPSVSAISGNNTSYDACILEFDIVPTCTPLTFSYIFGSEEYPEYINREFADGMVIMISGPGIAGTQNLAVVNGNTPVNIQNINQNNNSGLYNNNGGGASIEYDGFTDVLTATADVQPCSEYHIKIAVADIIDCIFDAGVFIAENSMDCGVNNAVVTDAIQTGVNPIEGCKTISIDFCRQGSTAAPFDVNLTFGGTAINGVDYVNIPSTITIPAGQQCITVVIDPINDGQSEGTETMELIYENISGACNLLDTIDIYVWDDQNLQTAFFNNDVCLNNTTFFNNTTSINPPATVSSFQWDFGDGNTSILYNPSNIYATAGTFDVKLIATSNSGCIDSVTQQVNVYDYPTASFTFTNTCLNTEAVFTNTSTNGSNDTIGTVVWNFGDGVSASTWDATHYYSLANSYPVVLEVFNSVMGCSSIFQDTIDIYPSVEVDFIAANVCFPNPIDFINLSVGNAQWEWDFGDASPYDATQNPTYTYAAPDTFDVRLVGITPDGCNDTITQQVYVFDAPVAQFTTFDTCANASAIFTNTSLDPTMGTLDAWYWTFSDNTASSAFSPLHNFPGPGVYDVMLIAYSSNLSCADTALGQIEMFPVPTADFTVQSVCHLLDVVPVNLSAGSINTYEWNFGDNTAIDFSADPTHLYANTGQYDIQLLVTSIEGCRDSVSVPVSVYELPVAQFTVEPVCDDFPASFQNTSSIGFPENIVTWLWDYGDGSPPETAVNANHVYPNDGDWDAELLVVSGHGCRDSLTMTVTIYPNPVPDFSLDTLAGCQPLCVNFRDLSSIATGNIVLWDWNLGDLTLTDVQNPVHCYYNDDNFTSTFIDVSLQVFSEYGCKSDTIFEDVIEVYPIPQAAFTFSPLSTTLLNPQVEFTDYSTNPVVWHWDFGEPTLDSDTSNEQHPLYDYETFGNMFASLIVWNSYGCSDTVTETVTIEPDFVIYAPNAFTPNGDGVNDVFKPEGLGFRQLEWYVFDRWGEKVFTGTDTITGWDGTVRSSGRLAPQGVYVYHIRAIDLTDDEYSQTGKLVLVRKPEE